MSNEIMKSEVSVDPETGVFVRLGAIINVLENIKIKELIIRSTNTTFDFHPSFSENLNRLTQLESLVIQWPALDCGSAKIERYKLYSLLKALRRLISLPSLKTLNIQYANNFKCSILVGFRGHSLSVWDVALEPQNDFSTPLRNSALERLTIKGSRNLEIISGYPKWTYFTGVILCRIKRLVLITTWEDISSGCHPMTENFLISLENQVPIFTEPTQEDRISGRYYQPSLNDLSIFHTYPSKDPQMYYPWYPFTLISLYKSITNLQVDFKIHEMDGQLLNMKHINDIIFDWFYDIVTPINYSFRNNPYFTLSLSYHVFFPEGLKYETNFRQKLEKQMINHFRRLDRHLDGVWSEKISRTRTVNVKLTLHNSGTKMEDWRVLTHGAQSPNPNRWNVMCNTYNRCKTDGSLSMPLLSSGFHFHVLSMDN